MGTATGSAPLGTIVDPIADDPVTDAGQNARSPTAGGPPLPIEIYSDVVCPWCYLGRRRLQAALGVLGRPEAFSIRWRAFELDPGAPTEPRDLRTAIERKYGPGAFDAMVRRLERLGSEAGITYRFDLARRVNSFDAHRLAAWAAATAGETAADRLHDRLFRAYFTEGANIADHHTLARCAAEVGLDAGAATEALASGAWGEAVRADEARAAELGITGVPTFIVADRLAIPGAQDVETLVALLTRALRRFGPAS